MEATEMHTLATRRNMHEVEARGKRCFAFSPRTFEQFSATPGDYWDLDEDVPLTDADGEPMVLAVKVTRYVDARTGHDYTA